MGDTLTGPLVFDTSAVFCFGHQGSLEPVLKQLAAKHVLLVPEAVVAEVLEEESYDYKHFLKEHFEMRVAHAGSPLRLDELASLSAMLDRGEVEVILLTHQTSGTAVIDERIARRVATERGLAVTGTFGVLRHAISNAWMTDNEALLAVTRMRANRFRCPSTADFSSFADYLAAMDKPG